MQLKQILLATGILAVLFISGCAQQSQTASFSCDYLSAGWVDDFESGYLVTPEEAVQCDSAKGSVVVVKMPASDALNVEAKMKGDMLSLGAAAATTSYESICSASGSLCVSDWVVSSGKLNGVGILDGNLAIIVANSEKPEDAETLMGSLWSKKSDIMQMLGT